MDVSIRKPILLAVVAAAYLLLPGHLLKFAALAFGVWVFMRMALTAPRLAAPCFAGAAAALFASGFLLNGLPAYLAAKGHGPATAWYIGFALAGMLWVALATGGMARPAPPARHSPPPLAAATLLGVLLLLNAVPLSMDLPHLGDEGYHVGCSCRYSETLQQLFRCKPFLLALALWLVAGAWFAAKALTAKRKELATRAQRKMERRTTEPASKPSRNWLFPAWAAALVLTLACAAAAIRQPALANLIELGIPTRYPSGEWFVTAALATFGRGQSNGDGPFMLEAFRFLPLAALFTLSLCLLADRRWAPRSRWAAILTGLAAALPLSVPSVFFHATTLYLELPLLVMAFLVLWDARRILSSDFPQLSRGWAWPALILLGLTKESAAPLLAALVALRLATRTWRCVKDKGLAGLCSWKFLLGELAFVVATCLPLALYLGIRMSLPSIRTYGGEWANLLDWQLQLHYLGCILKQFGVLWLPALGGAVLLAWRRRFHQLALAGAWLVGVYVFFLCDNKSFIGLARFDLLFLPPALLLSWEFLTVLGRWRHAAAIAVFLANLAFCPVGLDGTKLPYANCDERYYPYAKALEELRPFLEPKRKVLLANMPYPYSLYFTARRQGLNVDYHQISCPATKLLEHIASALRFAEGNGYDLIILRCGDGSDIPLAGRYGAFIMTQYLPAAKGGLALFVRVPATTPNDKGHGNDNKN